MRRREFLGVLGGVAVAWPFAARPQKMVPVIGFLNSASRPRFASLVNAFHEGLNSQGLLEGRDFWIDYQWAEGDYSKLPALASDLVQRNVALIAATGGTQSAVAAIKATSTVPILFVIGIDPVHIDLVSCLNRPSGNATGVSLYTTELATKRLELLREVVLPNTTLALLVNPGFEAIGIELRDSRASAHGLGLELIVLEART